MGGSKNEEFQVLVHSGEDILVACEACEYAANLEVAVSRVPPVDPADAGTLPARQVETPGQRSIEHVARFLQLPPNRLLKSLVFRAGERFAMAVVRGDHELNEDKLKRALGVREIELADAAAVQRLTSAPVGFAGPVGFSGDIFVDPAASQLQGAVCGANALDRHLLHVRFGRDYSGQVLDLRSVVDGDACMECGASLRRYRGIEAGHIFVLGTHYSQKMGATYLDREQQKQTLVMGCYGIGVSRLVATAVEQHHDDFGIAWPISVAPYQVHLVQLGDGERVQAAVCDLEAGLEAQGLELLVDDRDERPGVKFKDADLIGIPLRVTVGDRGLDKGQVELKRRSRKESRDVAVAGAVEAICQEVALLCSLDPKAALPPRASARVER
jgi:prolyl-tRNA synthetase